MAPVMTPPMALRMTVRRARGTVRNARNAHTRLAAELCTHVPIIEPTNWLVHIGKVRGFNYLAALAKSRVPSGGALGSMRYSLFQNEHARNGVLRRPSSFVAFAISAAKQNPCLGGTDFASAILAREPLAGVVAAITLSKLRISVVQYLNTAPLVRGFTHGPLRGKYELSFTVPSQCAEALRTGSADVAIIPAIEYQRIVSDGIGLTILPGLAIASKERVRSLLVISKVPIRQARRIALDRSSRSTQALTKILCARRWQIAPEFFEAAPPADIAGSRVFGRGNGDDGGTADNGLAAMLDNADAALIIGDAALRIAIAAERHVTPGPDGEWLTSAAALLAGSPDSPDSVVAAQRAAPAERLREASAAVSATALSPDATLHIYDVVKEWWHLTEKPAVLAVWAARNDSFAATASGAVGPSEGGHYANDAVTAELAADFLASRDFGLRHLPEICAEAAQQMQLPEKELRLYLEKNIDYGLDEENLQGLLSFFHYSQALNLVGPLQPISIAAGPDSPARFLDFSGEWRVASGE
jgi:predicted solute-binding protein